MASEYVNTVMVTQKTLARLENELMMVKFVTREFDDKFAVEGDKFGVTLNIRKPVYYKGRDGNAFRPEDTIETTVPLTINQPTGWDNEIPDMEMKFTVDRWMERYGNGAASIIANKIDTRLNLRIAQLSQSVGILGTDPTSVGLYATAKATLTNLGVPRTELCALISPFQEVNALGFQSNLFNPQTDIAKQYETGTMSTGTPLGMKWTMGQNVPVQTSGAYAGTPIVASLGAVGADGTTNTVNLSGLTNNITGWALAGDIIGFAGSLATNQASHNNTTQLKQFRVVSNVNSDGGGLGTVTIDPPMNPATDSAYQNVSALPAVNAAVFMYGQGAATQSQVASKTGSLGSVFHKAAFAFAAVPLGLPQEGVKSQQVRNERLGIAMRYMRGFDIRSNSNLTRFDVACGDALLQGQFGIRVCGS